MVHDHSAKVLSAMFVLTDLLCKAASLPKFYYQNILGSNHKYHVMKTECIM